MLRGNRKASTSTRRKASTSTRRKLLYRQVGGGYVDKDYMFKPELPESLTIEALSMDDATSCKVKSRNGTVSFIRFKLTNRSDIRVVVKSLRGDPIGDNLYYEYVAGLCINEFLHYFPFFVKTYGIGRYKEVINSKVSNKYRFQETCSNSINLLSKVSDYIKLMDETFLNMIHQIKENRSSISNDQINTIDETIRTDCKSPLLTCIFTQSVPDALSLYDFINESFYEGTYKPENMNQLIAIMYMLYGCLSTLSNNFTHYDLHANNILLYEIPDKKYLQVNMYVSDTESVPIYTQYIPIMIDYGRCFFESYNENLKDILSSTYFIDRVRSVLGERKDNKPRECGYGVGMPSNKETINLFESERFFINRRLPNKVQDQRILVWLKSLSDSIENNDTVRLPDYVKSFLKIPHKISKDVRLKTKLDPSVCNSFNLFHSICSVNDTFKHIHEKVVTKEYCKDNNNFYSDSDIEQYGTLNIYVGQQYQSKPRSYKFTLFSYDIDSTRQYSGESSRVA